MLARYRAMADTGPFGRRTPLRSSSGANESAGGPRAAPERRGRMPSQGFLVNRDQRERRLIDAARSGREPPGRLVYTSVARRCASGSRPVPGQRDAVCRPRAPVLIPGRSRRWSPRPTLPVADRRVHGGEWSSVGTGRAGLPRSASRSQAPFHVEQDQPAGRSATRRPVGPGRGEAPGACGAARGRALDARRPPASGRVTGEPAPSERCRSRREGSGRSRLRGGARGPRPVRTGADSTNPSRETCAGRPRELEASRHLWGGSRSLRGGWEQVTSRGPEAGHLGWGACSSLRVGEAGHLGWGAWSSLRVGRQRLASHGVGAARFAWGQRDRCTWCDQQVRDETETESHTARLPFHARRRHGDAARARPARMPGATDEAAAARRDAERRRCRSVQHAVTVAVVPRDLRDVPVTPATGNDRDDGDRHVRDAAGRGTARTPDLRPSGSAVGAGPRRRPPEAATHRPRAAAWPGHHAACST